MSNVGQHVEFKRNDVVYSGFIEEVVSPTGQFKVRVPGQWELIRVWPSQCVVVDTVALKQRIRDLEHRVVELLGLNQSKPLPKDARLM